MTTEARRIKEALEAIQQGLAGGSSSVTVKLDTVQDPQSIANAGHMEELGRSAALQEPILEGLLDINVPGILKGLMGDDSTSVPWYTATLGGGLFADFAGSVQEWLKNPSTGAGGLDTLFRYVGTLIGGKDGNAKDTIAGAVRVISDARIDGTHEPGDQEGIIWSTLKKFFEAAYSLQEQPIDGVLTTTAKAYGMALGAGLVASALAAAGESVLKHFGAGAAKYLAAIIGDLAAFGPMANASLGAIQRETLAVPWGYKVRGATRSHLPGLGDILRWRGKRILGKDKPFRGPGGEAIDFNQAMAYFGYSADIARAFDDDLYRELNTGELSEINSWQQLSDYELEEYLKLLTYSDADLARMKRVIETRSFKTELKATVSTLRQMHIEGFRENIFLDPIAEDLRLSTSYKNALGLQIATQSKLRDYRLSLDIIESQFSRGFLDEHAFRMMVEAMLPTSTYRDLRIQQQIILRYRRVWLYNEISEARKFLPQWLRYVVQGLDTIDSYRAKLLMALYSEEYVDMMCILAQRDRDMTLSANCRTFDIPTWREKVMVGVWSDADYEAMLWHAGYWQEHIKSEVQYAHYLAQQWAAGRFERYQLPAIEQQFIIGTVGEDLLRDSLFAAGLQFGEIDRRVQLDKLKRKAEEDRQQAIRDRKREKQQRELEKALAEQNAQLAATAAGLVAAAKLAAAAKPGSALGEMSGLIASLNLLYDTAHALMPGNLWGATLDLAGLVQQPGGPDPDRLASTLDSIYANLQALTNA